MKIKKISIKNFRSIKELSLFPENLNALVWPNSVWKTNILKAIDLVLWEWWTTKWKVIKELFNDINEPIEIKILFNEPILRDYFWHNKNIQVITLKMTYDPWNFGAEVRLRELNGTELVWWTNGQWYYVNDERKKTCCFIYIPALRNLDQEMRVNQWSMLGKMMKEIQDNYIESFAWWEDILKSEFETLMKPAKDFLEADFNTHPNVLTFHKFMEEFQRACWNNSLWLANSFTTKLNIYNLNRFYKTLQIHLREDLCDKDFEILEVGSGMQNLVLLSIFQTYAKLMAWKVIFGIEEPEIYLYPQAQRWLYQSFQNLSEHTQIFYTTHNPNFVDAYRAPEVRILWKDEDWTHINEKNTTVVNWTEQERTKFKIYTQFNTERNELFFAKKVLLVEWKSDKILFSTLALKRWIDLNKEGISIIDCWWKGWVLYFLGVCKVLWINNYFWIRDEDNWDEYDDRYNIFQSTLTESKWHQIPGNLEIFLNGKTWITFSSSSSKKVQQAYERANWVEIASIPTEFDAIKNYLIWQNVEEEVLPF